MEAPTGYFNLFLTYSASGEEAMPRGAKGVQPQMPVSSE